MSPQEPRDQCVSRWTEELIDESMRCGEQPCPVHLVVEPCPTCEAYIAGGL